MVIFLMPLQVIKMEFPPVKAYLYSVYFQCEAVVAKRGRKGENGSHFQFQKFQPSV